MIIVMPDTIRLDLAPNCVGIAMDRVEAWESAHQPNSAVGLWQVDGAVATPVTAVLPSDAAQAVHGLPAFVYPLVWNDRVPQVQAGGPYPPRSTIHRMQFLGYHWKHIISMSSGAVHPFSAVLERTTSQDGSISWTLYFGGWSYVLPRYDPNCMIKDELAVGEVLEG